MPECLWLSGIFFLRERMSKNIEIKARYPDLEKAENIARRLGAKFLGKDFQTDTFFNVPNGRLKLRESLLSGNILIPYLRSDQKEAKEARYVLLPVKDVSTTKALFGEILGERLIVEKTRRIYLLENIRIHLDEVTNLGNYLEFEAVIDAKHPEEESQATLDELLEKFGVQVEHLIAGAYADLLQEKLNREGNNV